LERGLGCATTAAVPLQGSAVVSLTSWVEREVPELKRIVWLSGLPSFDAQILVSEER
jgi:hypothetical protein